MNFNRRLFLPVIALMALMATHQGYSQTKDEQTKDTNAYLEAVEKMKNEPLEKQISILHSFLDEHPDTSFRSEIENNLKRLEDLLTETDPIKKREARDTERYLRAVEFAKKLSLDDQAALWEQFLEENPQSLYRREAKTNLENARRKSGKGAASPPANQAAATSLPVVKEQPPKDRNTAILLATFPGLVVPALGHWYAQDYSTAGILTGVRVVGLALGIPGIVNKNAALIILGGVATLFGYGVDIFNAPLAVDRYNEQAESKPKTGAIPSEITVSFSF